MRGPISILKDNLLVFHNLPASLDKRSEDFLEEIK